MFATKRCPLVVLLAISSVAGSLVLCSAAVTRKIEGDACDITDDRQQGGRWTKLADCPAAQSYNSFVNMLLGKLTFPADLLVCCATPQLDNKPCQSDFADTDKSASLPATVQEPFNEESPFLAELSRPDRTVLEGCAGALISSAYVLTTGECIYELDIGYARIGTRNRSPAIPVAEEILHPEYGGINNNCGLLRLQHPVTFTGDVHPTCLPQNYKIDLHDSAFELSGSDNTANTKRHMTALEWSKCTGEYGHLETAIAFEPQYVCAASTQPDLPCLKRKGSPLTTRKSERFCSNTIVGIISFTTSQCAATPFVQIYRYVDWINSVLSS